MSDQLPTLSDDKSIRPRKTFPLKLLLWAFGIWGLLGWLRFIRAVMAHDFVIEFLSDAVFIYMVGSGLVLGLAVLPVIWGSLRRCHWAGRLAWVTAVLFPVLYWFERQVLWQDPGSQENWLFMILLTLVWFGLVFWALGTKRSREYFQSCERIN